jgi:hypothetical protein
VDGAIPGPISALSMRNFGVARAVVLVTAGFV